jgi:glycine/D-amino acid oxidase-like deaminating enzyme
MLTRRQLIGGAATSAVSLCLPAVFARANGEPAAGNASALRGGELLRAPDFTLPRNHAPYVAGIRPHRKGGVRLSLEPPFETASGPKFLIHNYGHSGAGITLSFGCASKVREHVETALTHLRGIRRRPAVAVLGCGVAGLTVAHELRRRWSRLPITLYAKSPDITKTTSFIAGGQFEPSQVWREYIGEDKRPILEDYLRRAAARIREIEDSGTMLRYGIVRRKNYTLDVANPAFDDYTPRDVVPAFRRGMLPFENLKDVGREYSTWLINPTILLPRLSADLRRHGVRFRSRSFEDIEQINGLHENIVINCTGYGAKKLFGDDALAAHRGHLVVLHNPSRLKYLFSGGCTNDVISYVFARQHDIVVGGTLVNDEREEFDGTDARDAAICDVLVKNAQQVFAGRPDACTFPT